MVLSLTDRFRRIRRLSHEDVPALMEWDSDPELLLLVGKKFQDNDDASCWWDRVIRDRSRLVFAIVDDNARLIGDVELLHIRWRAHEAELRICIGDKRSWNHGYGTDALQEALGAAFGYLALRRVYLRVRLDNRRAIHAYQKVGFRPVGRLDPTGRLRGQPPLQLMEITRDQVLDAALSARVAGVGSTARS